MSESVGAEQDKRLINNLVEAALRIGLIFILLVWSFGIIRPFSVPIMWGAIIAIAMFPLVKMLSKAIGDRQTVAAALITILSLAVLVVPTIIISESLVESAIFVADKFESGDVAVPQPPENVANWPLIGEKTFQIWSLASTNLQQALETVEPQLKAIGTWLIGQVASSVGGVLLFIVSIFIAGVFMAKSNAVVAATKELATRLVGDQGADWADLSAATVKSVVQGVLGVAVIQTALCALGMIVMDVPGAGVWSVLVLLVAIVQLPPTIIMLPIIAYVFTYADTTPAVIFAIWSILAGSSDTLLKPLLLGRGVDVPMLIILLGAIGGMITGGIIGLFVGAVVLAIWYKLFSLWLSTPRA
jgi:predicted PurR-regulated permease PerM